ncbi:spore germination protein [Paenactinomyces guangxiensis]|uniref:Spore germination protein n=1 Tax=Paenactinomyces guangxiensis TaxID=1490290 RepID=A0A7W1WSU1_9BACL|nr:spore germination protein [Paenactinomyces guangxiensis]MBA4495413.1 spore germination protein [Paenactinomyces guangxiensis]MBH8592466.1 spore germination protein [Paenactinomyces guangxiensis]
MGTVNNIFNLKINNVSSSGIVNFGSSINIAPESYNKIVGGATPIGDFTRNIDLERNILFDPDVADMPNV